MREKERGIKIKEKEIRKGEKERETLHTGRKWRKGKKGKKWKKT